MNSVIMGRLEAAFVEVVYFALPWHRLFLGKVQTFEKLEFLLSSSTLGFRFHCL